MENRQEPYQILLSEGSGEIIKKITVYRNLKTCGI